MISARILYQVDEFFLTCKILGILLSFVFAKSFWSFRLGHSKDFAAFRADFESLGLAGVAKRGHLFSWC